MFEEIALRLEKLSQEFGQDFDEIFFFYEKVGCDLTKLRLFLEDKYEVWTEE